MTASDPVLSGGQQLHGVGQFMALEGLLLHYDANVLNSQGFAMIKKAEHSSPA